MITLRPILKADAKVFSELRNSNDTYLWFYSQQKFTIKQVEQWIENLDPDKDMVFMVYDNEQVIGTCSLYNIENIKAEVGRIIVKEDCRGKGIGSHILEQITNIAIAKELKLLYANIKTDNMRSYRAFEKAGYKRIEERIDTGYYYEKSL